MAKDKKFKTTIFVYQCIFIYQCTNLPDPKQAPKNSTMNAGIWTFTLVGMKYNGSSAQEVKMFDELGVFSQPDNPVDKNAIIVRGFYGEEWKDLGHVSMSSQPPKEYGLPKYGAEGTVYKVVEAYSNTAQSAAVHIRLELETAMKADEYTENKIEQKRLKDEMMSSTKEG